MNIACLKHVVYDGPAFLPRWASQHDHRLQDIMVPEDGVPDPAAFDRFIIIGGPMSIWEEDRHPWLAAERSFVADCVEGDRPILGICLGAQLLAAHFGAPVRAGRHREIGWFPVERDERVLSTWLGDALPERFDSFFWHADVFGLPDGAYPIASSAAHPVQGFVMGRHLALQFHLEVTPEWASRLAQRDAHELQADRFVQSAERLLARPPQSYSQSNRLMEKVLERWLAS
jgi:GMP synthase (glutamine-hydrolysing)